MKIILKQMMPILAVLLLAAASGSAQVLSPVYSFDNETNDLTHNAGLLLSGNTLYGTALGSVYSASHGREGGDPALSGAVFKLSTDGKGFTNFYIFSPVDGNSMTNTDGANSAAQLVLSGNTLYGTAENGGFYAKGTVFAINTDGTGFTNLYNFGASGTNDGAIPSAGLVLSGNTLYGATGEGGSSGNGTIFAIHTDGTGFTNLYNFADGGGSGRSGGMRSNLILSNNILYGTTSTGGSAGNGTVFAVNTDGTDFTNLHSFNGSDGAGPSAGLVLSGSTLYGTTAGHNITFNEGTVFAINTDGTSFATLHTFAQPTYEVSGVYTNADGAGPVGNLILSGSTLYGATQLGGTNGFGTMFALDLSVAAPTIQFTASPTNGVPPMSVQFSSPAVDAGGNAILAWNWNFGDGSNSIVQNPTHAYSNAATFFPTLTCVNNNGDTVSGSGPAIITAYPRSILNGGFEAGTFTNWTKAYDYSAVSTGSTYALLGKYGAALETGGTMGFLSQTLATAPGAVYLISFWLDSPRNYTVTNDFQVSWNGNVLLDKANLPAIGWTNIQLTVTATATLSTLQFGYLNGYFYFGLDDVTASSPPQPPGMIQFTASPASGILPLAVHFSSPAVDAGGNTILAWMWKFGDGSNSIEQNPTHTYTNAATFFPTLTCINSNGSTVIGSGPAITVEYPRSILNGGFETGTFTNWTKGRYRDYTVVSTDSKYAHSGTYGAALESDGPMGFLSQTLATTPGAVYLISFGLDSPYDTDATDFQVSWNGNVLLDKTNLTAIGWTNIQLTVTATATLSTLQFGYLNYYGYFGLDDISVSSSQPLGIAGFNLVGANLVLNGTGGLSNRTYYVLMGTNLTEPFNQWTPVATNVPGADGNFNITATNAVDSKGPGRFYILQLQ
ncbi:MAG TPA: choice-of-anchor tandem repeat GloVer-containing protein [Verrucomicrobiae bacterium]